MGRKMRKEFELPDSEFFFTKKEMESNDSWRRRCVVSVLTMIWFKLEEANVAKEAEAEILTRLKKVALSKFDGWAFLETQTQLKVKINDPKVIVLERDGIAIISTMSLRFNSMNKLIGVGTIDNKNSPIKIGLVNPARHIYRNLKKELYLEIPEEFFKKEEPDIAVSEEPL